MGPSGPQWAPRDTNGIQQTPMGTNGPQWVPMNPNGSQWTPTTPITSSRSNPVVPNRSRVPNRIPRSQSHPTIPNPTPLSQTHSCSPGAGMGRAHPDAVGPHPDPIRNSSLQPPPNPTAQPPPSQYLSVSYWFYSFSPFPPLFPPFPPPHPHRVSASWLSSSSCPGVGWPSGWPSAPRPTRPQWETCWPYRAAVSAAWGGRGAP